MKQTLLRIVVFLVLNFLALGLGGFFTGDGVVSTWYTTLDQAPWTPPGWVFGFAWTSIMILFAIYMSLAWEKIKKPLCWLAFYLVQWVLNVAWNPVFFKYHAVGAGLVIIMLLTLLIAITLFYNWKRLKNISFLLLPYFLWLLIASSLNAYILIYN